MTRVNDSTTTDSTQRALRSIPSVNDLIERANMRSDLAQAPRPVLTSAVREVIDDTRSKIRSNRISEAPTIEALEEEVAALVGRKLRSPLEPAINATGILLHTGLGRAPMPDSAARAIEAVARGYAPVELHMESGKRGSRSSIVAPLLCELTGAEAATVVNNNAAALLIVLRTLSQDQEVIVSRGELIEIGGSFRLPEVIESGGAKLREVGTTNKTKLQDYTRAIGADTGAILKVHPSNYRIEGFTQGAEIDELVSLGRAHDLPVIHDIGSGLLWKGMHEAIDEDEPDARSSIAAGADVVIFSGDKLLGGPQAGIILGSAEVIARIDKNPLKRALRVDKLTLAGLGVTLGCYRDEDTSQREIPLLAMLNVTIDVLRERGERIAAALTARDDVALAEIRETQAYIGGGSVPAHAIASIAIELRAKHLAEDELARRLRTGSPRVVPRVSGESIWLDLRTVPGEQDANLMAALEAAFAQRAE